MATTISQWTLEAMNNARAKNQFILVSPTGASRVFITDAITLWSTDPTIVFQTGYRIAGTPKDIIDVLSQQGIQQEAIGQLLDSAITSDNYSGEFSQIYNDEISLYNNWRRSVVKANVDAPGVKLFDIMVTINPELLTRMKTDKQAKSLGLPTGTTTKTRGKKVVSLLDKINTLPPGKFLDVSHLEPNGTGARTADPPTQRSRKYGIPGIPIISADLDHYLLAINMLPGGEVHYASEVAQIRDLFSRLTATRIGGTTGLFLPELSPSYPCPQIPLLKSLCLLCPKLHFKEYPQSKHYL